MSTRQATLLTTLAITTLALTTTTAAARSTREFLTSFGSFVKPAGIAVDLETGNVYVTDRATDTVDIFGATGGPPADGVPSQITGLYFEPADYTPIGVAVDNSCYEHNPRLTGSACEEYDPSYGDVYVVEQPLGEHHRNGFEKFKLNPGHGYELISSLAATSSQEAMTVDSRGNLYIADFFDMSVMEYKKVLEKVVNGGIEETVERLEKVTIPEGLTRHPGYVALDDLGDVYVSNSAELGGPSEGYFGVAKLKLDASGGVVSEEILAGNLVDVPRPVAVDRATSNVFVGNATEIAEYDSAGVLQLVFGSTEPLGGSFGTGGNGAKAIAVNSETDRVYVVNALHDDVDVFGSVVGPPVFEATQPAASGVSRTSALIAGTVNPESGSASYRFEYVDAAGYEAGAAEPYRQGGRTATQALAGGHAPQTVERVVLSGLHPGTTYHYRMVASNATATTYGPDETFTTAAATPPAVMTGAAVDVSATGVTLSGVVGPRGLPTSYVFEVGTDSGYGGAKLFGSAGSGTGEVPVSVRLEYLVPGTTYHYRLVAMSFDGTSYGQDATFTTAAVPSPIAQPAGAPLIASPTVQFPSIAGAITEPTARKNKTRLKKRKARRHAKRRKAGKGGG